MRFLQVASVTDYAAYSADCDQRTAATLPAKPTKAIHHTYQNLVSRVTDDLGYPVANNFLEFYERPQRAADASKIDDLMVQVHAEILEDVHVYGNDHSYRSLIFDLTDLDKALADGEKLMFSLSAAPLSKLIGFTAGQNYNDISELAVDLASGQSFWRPNQTLLADLTIERTQTEEAFTLLNACCGDPVPAQFARHPRGRWHAPPPTAGTHKKILAIAGVFSTFAHLHH